MIFVLDDIKYDFLRQNPDLKNIAYLVVSGSHSYGTNNENSDIDLRGFLVEGKKYLLGSESFEQFEDLPTDTVIYGMKKFFRLCLAANPNALELLGADEECIALINESGQKVRDNADLFLSKRVINSFGNYASAQLRRLSNALCHDQFSLKQQEKHLKETLLREIDHFNRTYSSFDKNAIRLHNDEGNQILMDIKLEGYPVRDFVGIYSEMRETVKTFDKLKHRNRKKDEMHLFKHAMHLMRLLITGTDILDGRGIITKRMKEHDLLMDIRNGKYSYEDIFLMAEEYRTKFEIAAKNTKLPDKPDTLRIKKLQIDLFEDYLTKE
ncbi:MAG: nucleotidyltransferase domain-containing protein [Lachnospiraceae bacterium]|nr:nucleotidyltransferase domain-containing protein [Lachnospiraceae bacterium]